MYNRAEININFTSVQLASDFIVVYNIKDSVTLDPQYVKLYFRFIQMFIQCWNTIALYAVRIVGPIVRT